jgi:hypothetical protein
MTLCKGTKKALPALDAVSRTRQFRLGVLVYAMACSLCGLVRPCDPQAQAISQAQDAHMFIVERLRLAVATAAPAVKL